ncbi:hypothetical protein [Streptomyces sp. NPDC090994]|uniref:hypothetical protein n=1 Tax=Streptomyces sp. NPDC090994 TaxID=3365969 RepID=UPI00382DF786
MRTRSLRLGLYGDAEGLAWAGGVVDEAVAVRGARVVERTVVTALPEDYDHLVEQWAWEHPGEDPGRRKVVELYVRLRCSLRVWRAVRKAVLRGLCPEGDRPHVCRVPWSA